MDWFYSHIFISHYSQNEKLPKFILRRPTLYCVEIVCKNAVRRNDGFLSLFLWTHPIGSCHFYKYIIFIFHYFLDESPQFFGMWTLRPFWVGSNFGIALPLAELKICSYENQHWIWNYINCKFFRKFINSEVY